MELMPSDAIELKPASRIELVATGSKQIVFLRSDMEVELEAIGGGGGGGGSTRGNSGGSGGKAGQAQFLSTILLKKGSYTVEVGQGGIGGAGKGSYDDGEPDYAQPGAVSRVFKTGGTEIVNAVGGARGEPNQTGRVDGGPGQNTVNSAGTKVADGGKGGGRDRDGQNGEAPGAGGGGCGVFVAGGALRGGRGGDGRVIFQSF